VNRGQRNGRSIWNFLLYSTQAKNSQRTIYEPKSFQRAHIIGEDLLLRTGALEGRKTANNKHNSIDLHQIKNIIKRLIQNLMR
jgi:hypothetical protein